RPSGLSLGLHSNLAPVACGDAPAGRRLPGPHLHRCAAPFWRASWPPDILERPFRPPQRSFQMPSDTTKSTVERKAVYTIVENSKDPKGKGFFLRLGVAFVNK